MKRLFYLFVLFLLMGFNSCAKSPEKEKRCQVEVETTYGTMIFELYNETPKHRDNFMHLVKERFYDGLIFHRVIKEFMVQGGDVKTRTADSDSKIDADDLAYTIPAEISDSLFHRKGALAAARLADDANPKRESSASQFYIVQGRKYTEEELHNIEHNKQEAYQRNIRLHIFEEHEADFNRYVAADEQDSLASLRLEIRRQTEQVMKENPLPKFTDAQRKIYMEEGGSPSLDGEYTVFGQLVEGFDVLDKIADAQVDRYDRPMKPISMKIRIKRR
ncbi:MAG: peptidylprolyl isomerase [Mangrovibacterium sp.]